MDVLRESILFIMSHFANVDSQPLQTDLIRGATRFRTTRRAGGRGDSADD